jgi:nicotinate-nucleotide adenylyltransferase
MEIGIFGGTFDPVHLAHLRAAEEFAEKLALDRVLMVVSGVPPHRSQPAAPPADRLKMLQIAIEDNPLLQASDVEIKREGPHFTLDTVRQVREETGCAMPFLALGVDAYLEIRTWKKPEEVLAETHLAILTRPGFETDLLSPVPESSKLMYRYQGGVFVHRTGTTLRKIEVTALDISSRAIRNLAQEGRSLRYLVPEGVFEYIQQKGIYRSSSTHSS